MPLFEKHFTLEEARSWLPELRRIFERIHALYTELQDLQADYEKVQAVIRANGHGPKDTGFEAHVAELQLLVKEILSAGIEIKDVSRGLVDFPHMRNGEEVFLCWELVENNVDYWHSIEDGYAGREPVDE